MPPSLPLRRLLLGVLALVGVAAFNFAPAPGVAAFVPPAAGVAAFVPTSEPQSVSRRAGRSAKSKSKTPTTGAPAPAVLWPKVATATATLLETQHYLRRPLDFQFSKRALDRYFDVLDPERLYFLQSDLAEFQARFGATFAAGLKAGNLEAVDAVHARYSERLTTFCHTASALAGGDWDFSSPWNTELSRGNAPWPADETQAQELWTAQVGAELLECRLAGVAPEKATAQVQKRLANLLKHLQSASAKDRLSPALLALARACDAHSDYLTQEELEDTESELRLSRIGIGVTLDLDPAGLRVAGLMAGGPAQRDGRLRVNDRIVAVAEETGAFRELDGIPMPQALALLRGQRGSLVRLKVLPARASDPAQRLIVGIRREEMRSFDGESYAKIIHYPSQNGDPALRLAWLVIPAFYGDEPDASGHRSSSVSRDVSVLLRRLQAENVEGIVLDFRANLGGLLDEAVEIGGLFCGRVPIAQVHAPNEETEILIPLRMRSQKPLYSGPLLVLTDHSSASASELVAGALQDYGRAVVVGGEQTFGKGSVQTTLPLEEYLGYRIRLPVGGLALTVGKFYRVSGQSTQLLGVRPDIILPSTLDVPHEGEASLVDPLQHDAIDALPTPRTPQISQAQLQKLSQRSSQRVQASSAFAAVSAERDLTRKERQENRLSLQETERRSLLETARSSYSERESAIELNPNGARFCRLLLEDTKIKRLKLSNEDPLASRDPESVATEEEALKILADLALLEPRKKPAAAPEISQNKKTASRP